MLPLFALTEHTDHAIYIQSLPLKGLICELGSVTSEVEILNQCYAKSHCLMLKCATCHFHILCAP